MTNFLNRTAQHISQALSRFALALERVAMVTTLRGLLSDTWQDTGRRQLTFAQANVYSLTCLRSQARNVPKKPAIKAEVNSAKLC